MNIKLKALVQITIDLISGAIGAPVQFQVDKSVGVPLALKFKKVNVSGGQALVIQPELQCTGTDVIIESADIKNVGFRIRGNIGFASSCAG